MFSKSHRATSMCCALTKQFFRIKKVPVISSRTYSVSVATKILNEKSQSLKYRDELNIYKTYSAKLRPDLEEDSKKFNALYPDVKREIVDHIVKLTNVATGEHVSRAMDYIVLGGKQFRFGQLITAYKALTNESERTPEMLHKIYMLGWVCELGVSISVLHDDIIDSSTMRRGRPCWQCLPDIGIFAVNDCFTILEAGYLILKNHWRDLPCYVTLYELVSDNTLSTHAGQTMDFVQKCNLPELTLDKLRRVQIAKTADFLFYMPLAMSMAITGRTNHESIKKICDEMGYYHQSQNDFLDIFNIGGALNKTSNDIENGSVSWLAVNCYDRANSEEKKILVENFGKHDPECVERVKELYLKTGLPEFYKEFSYETYDNIRSLIAQASCDDKMKNGLYEVNDLLFHRKTVH